MQTAGRQQESKEDGETSNYGFHGLGHEIPINLLINNNYLYTYLSYLLEEVVSSSNC